MGWKGRDGHKLGRLPPPGPIRQCVGVVSGFSRFSSSIKKCLRETCPQRRQGMILLPFSPSPTFSFSFVAERDSWFLASSVLPFLRFSQYNFFTSAFFCLFLLFSFCYLLCLLLFLGFLHVHFIFFVVIFCCFLFRDVFFVFLMGLSVFLGCILFIYSLFSFYLLVRVFQVVFPLVCQCRQEHFAPQVFPVSTLPAWNFWNFLAT